MMKKYERLVHISMNSIARNINFKRRWNDSSKNYKIYIFSTNFNVVDKSLRSSRFNLLDVRGTGQSQSQGYNEAVVGLVFNV